MKKLILLLFIPFVCYGQEDIERYKVYNTTNIYTSLLLDSATGRIWQLQIGVGDTDRLETVLSDRKLAKSIETITKEWDKEMKPYALKEYINERTVAKNGRFKLYHTDNMYNFIMVDVINGNTYQVQWNTKSKKRFVSRFW